MGVPFRMEIGAWTAGIEDWRYPLDRMPALPCASPTTHEGKCLKSRTWPVVASHILGPQPANQTLYVIASDRSGHATADGGAELVAVARAGGDDQALPFARRKEALVLGEGVGTGHDLAHRVLVHARHRGREQAQDRFAFPVFGLARGIRVVLLPLVKAGIEFEAAIAGRRDDVSVRVATDIED